MTNEVSSQASEAELDSTFIGHDDFALVRVPDSERYSWFSVALQRFGQLSALAQFFLAAMIGLTMGFWQAMLAITIGAVLLEIVTIFVGIAGQREGMSTSVLARWTGFGRYGSALVGIAMAISLTGWFGVQNEVFANGLFSIWPGVPLWVWCIVGGIAVTLIVVYGFVSMNWVAYVTVPAFLLLCVFSIGSALKSHRLADLMSSNHPGPAMPLAFGITMVAGGFIVGAVMTPDMSRYNRTPMDVVKQTVVGVTLGEYFVGVIGVLLAHTFKTVTAEQMQQNAGLVVGLVQGTVGTLGVLILVASILKINDWNLYPSSLGIVNAVHTFTGKRINRAMVAVVLGVLGSILSAMGFASKFQTFLVELGMVFPPIAAIMIADYFIVKSWRSELDESRASGALPARMPAVVPAGLISWVLGYAVAKILSLHPDWIPAVNVPALVSLVAAFVIYVVLGKAGLGRGVGIHDTPAV